MPISVSAPCCIRLPQLCVVYTRHLFINSDVFNRISILRQDREMSRRELAESVGVNPQTVGYLERGDYKPSLELAMKIAAVFDLPVELVFSFKAFPSVSDVLRRAG